MASEHHEDDRACGCHQSDADCAGLTVRRLSQGRIMPVASKRPRRLSDAELSGEQQTKTALTYFSRGLKVKATADA